MFQLHSKYAATYTVATYQQVTTVCNFRQLPQTKQFHQDATNHAGVLQLVSCRLVVELVAASLWITDIDNQLKQAF